MFSKKVFAIVSKFRFISRANFMLGLVECEKKFYNLLNLSLVLEKYNDLIVRKHMLIRCMYTLLTRYQKKS